MLANYGFHTSSAKVGNPCPVPFLTLYPCFVGLPPHRCDMRQCGGCCSVFLSVFVEAPCLLAPTLGQARLLFASPFALSL